jgi:hypothetical protein
MARKVRFSFPTQVTARMLERQQLAVKNTTAAPAANFLRAAAGLGYSLGRPLNAFIAKSAGQLLALDPDTLATVKTLHRIYQVTPTRKNKRPRTPWSSSSPPSPPSSATSITASARDVRRF